MEEEACKRLRYESGGELHRDFHASVLDGVDYVRDNYGEDALREVLFETGTKVYRTLHERLLRGDVSELLACGAITWTGSRRSIRLSRRTTARCLPSACALR